MARCIDDAQPYRTPHMTRCHHKFCLPHDKDPKLHTHMPPSWLVEMNCRVIEVMERINNDCHLGELVVGAYALVIPKSLVYLEVRLPL